MENVNSPKAAWNLNGCQRAMSDCKSSVASTRPRVEAALLSCSEGLYYTKPSHTNATMHFPESEGRRKM